MGRYTQPNSIKQYKHNILCHFDVLSDPQVHIAKPYNHNWLMQQSLLKHYLSEVQSFREFLNMPKPKPLSNDWKGFINYKLNETEKENFLAWDLHDDDIWLLVSQANTEGYRFTTSYNSQNSNFNASLSCNDKASPNNGYSLSAFAPTWYAAIRIVLFKHVVVFNYVWDIKKVASPEENWG